MSLAFVALFVGLMGFCCYVCGWFVGHDIAESEREELQRLRGNVDLQAFREFDGRF